ncbi:hypothetical protein LWP59_22820 [Amycolatopsis acidiphila]|uniref:DUF2092 domain-containing protein n=1 Tax=Amycolatopsis acidiphila TaxID=715473 RepID=A0A558A886_9PSEU|nr:hypothetical protein [Amycolatopsis acidiphila]TVT20470.1 hypothetical protein FNH06_20200 [Amycolatopsis acidiphila]UIJ56992.1 hypothetical protein LWP59_22820 [Amycolatopsis acidiphila]GHG53934.1 hypothetical protein GCM10017788_03140 [Amycolatopsis acidiphila]
MSLSVVRQAKQRRWTVVAAVAAVLVAIPSIVAAVRPAGPAADAGRLRDLVLRSDTAPYQGDAHSTGALALPELPNLADVTALFSATTTVRAWYAGPDRYRVAVLTTAGERDTYRLPGSEYTWDYGTNTLTEVAGQQAVRLPRASDLLPPELARRLLSAAPADPVTALPGRNVAGVAASGLRLAAADPDTTIGQADIWADPATGLPLRVEVTARGQHAPGLVTEFDDVDQSRPVVTAPQPAPGSGFNVSNAPDIANALGALGRVRLPTALSGHPVRDVNFAGVQGAALYGTGLATFTVVAVPANIADSAADAAGKAGAATETLAAGTGVFLSITPLSLAIVHRPGARSGYLLAGLVGQQVLRAAADELSQLRRGGR